MCKQVALVTLKSRVKLKAFAHGVDLAQLRLAEKLSAGLCFESVSC